MQAIAEQLSYATSGNFSGLFQRRFSYTPRDWSRLAITSCSALRRNLSAFFSLVNPLFGQ